jgi:hypothetical protein
MVYAAKAPAAVSVNGDTLPVSTWVNDPGDQVVMLENLPAGTVLVRFR